MILFFFASTGAPEQPGDSTTGIAAIQAAIIIAVTR